MQIDLTNVDENNSNEDLGPVPEGRYDFIIDDARLFKAKTGTPMFEIRLSILDGEYKNRKAWRRFALTQKALGFLNELLDAIGSDLSGTSFDTKQLKPEVMNAKVSAYLTIEDYQGKKSNSPEKFTKARTSSTPLASKQPASKAPEEEEEDIFA